jgi:hypothetical protein
MRLIKKHFSGGKEIKKKLQPKHGDTLCDILCEIKEGIRCIMSAISDFSAKQKEFNDRIDAAVTGLESDVQLLNEKIDELQNTPGTITPEDQALLDELQARGATIAEKLEALDSLTPPKPPVA